MKKTIALIIAVMMVVTLTACGADTTWSVRYTVGGNSDLTDEQIAAVNPDSEEGSTVEAAEITAPGGLYAAFIARTYTEMLSAGQIHSGEPLSKQMIDDSDFDHDDFDGDDFGDDDLDDHDHADHDHADLSGSDVSQEDSGANKISAADFLNRRAKELICEYIVLNRRLADLGIEYVRDEYIETQIASTYNSEKQYFSKLGVGQESFAIAFADYDAMLSLAFDAAYGAGGYAEVPEQFLIDYYEREWLKATFISRLYYNETTMQPMTDEEKDELRQTYENYTACLNGGALDGESVENDILFAMGMGMTLFEALYTQHSYDEDQLRDAAENQLIRLETATDEIKQLKNIPVGEYMVVDNEYLISIFRHEPIDDAEHSEYYANRSALSLLQYYKESEFEKNLLEAAGSLTDVVWNDAIFTAFDAAKLKLDR
ncbi:MAG: hypothetical protein FWE86_04580 [Oscillospiraceae bacterium]|nr:hypothetical protein [Oscillospiraceae bacterium]